MRFLRRYHRFVRVLLFMAIAYVLVAGWRAIVNPRLLDLATLGEFAVTFILIGVAAIVTHRIARWVAPAEKGQVDEDSEDVVTMPLPRDF